MDALLDPTTGDYTGQRTTTLANAVYLRLMTRLGSYWADLSLGSRLHELQREKDKDRVYLLAQQYAEQALKPLIKDGRAASIEVAATRLRPGVCFLEIQVVDRSGQQQTFYHHVRIA